LNNTVEPDSGVTILNNTVEPDSGVTILNNTVEPDSGVTILFNTVDNCEQCGQQNIVQSCFHQYCVNLSVFTHVNEEEM
jgi:hypothetical protein